MELMKSETKELLGLGLILALFVTYLLNPQLVAGAIYAPIAWILGGQL